MAIRNRVTLSILGVILATFALIHFVRVTQLNSAFQGVKAEAIFAGSYADFAYTQGSGKQRFADTPQDLTVASFQSQRISLKTMQSLALMPRLQFVHLLNCELPVGGIDAVAESSSIRVLVFSGSNLTDNELAEVCRMPNVACVSVAYTDVTAGGVSAFAKNSTVKLLAVGELKGEVMEPVANVDRLQVGIVDTLTRFLVPRTHIVH